MKCGRILQINVSKGGIPKLPILQAFLTTLGFDGDSCRHPKYHGGPKQAVLLITSEGLGELRTAGFEVFPGALGENLTSAGLSRYDLRVGSCLAIGAALIRITKMRVPCSALNPLGTGIQKAIFDRRVKGEDAASHKWGLAGFYAEVLQTGLIRQGDTIALEDNTSSSHATSV